ncbi:MAG: hypothetical protein JWO14_3030 [Solirubrobacterales bacterium]|nr:hypothetical protein [Solirubrobacterales bacterium]
MCGVAGIVVPDIDADAGRRAVGSMLSEQGHRGPDELGIVGLRGAALGVARLAIVDGGGSRQPMISPDRRFTLCLNGEVLNYPELRQHPALRDWNFVSDGDTEVALALLARLGPSALPLFNGQFAGGLWDAERRQLLLFRDRFGILPLYYAELPEGIAFASTIRALMRLDPVDCSLDPAAVSDLFCLWAPHPPHTICAGVRQLPPARWAMVSGDRTVIQGYWEPVFGGAELGPGEAEEELRAALEGAVVRNLRADRTVGTLVSGGLDSAVITAMAASHGERSTFSVTFEDGLHDESRYQRQVAAQAATHHASVLATPAALASVLPDVVTHAEAPFLRITPCASYLLGELVSGAGVRAVVSGEGADELLCGYDVFRQLEARGGEELDAVLSGGTPAERVPGRVLSLLIEADDARTNRFPAQRLRWGAARRLRGYLTEELRQQLDDPVERLTRSLPSDAWCWSELRRAQYVEMRTMLPDYILGTQGERMLMAHSVEARVPFLDNEVVAVALRLADEQKLRGTSEKDVLRRIARDLVPAPVLARRKQAYRAPAAAALGSDAAADALALLSPTALRAHGIFESSKVERLLRRLRAGDRLSETQEMALTGIVTTQLWLELVAGRRHERKEMAA